MQKSIIKLGEFKIVGISVRTTNSNGLSRQDIAELWELFIQDHLADKIPHKKIRISTVSIPTMKVI